MWFRVVIALFLTFCVVALSQAQFNGCASGFCAPKAIGGGGGCSQATTYLARLTSPSGNDTTGMTTTICNMVTHGTYTLLDYYYQFALNSTTNALINVPNSTYTTTVHGTPTFSSEHGYTNSGSDWIDLGFNPVSAAGNMTDNCTTIGNYSLTSRTTVATVVPNGGDDNIHYTYLLLFQAGPNVQADVNGAGFASISSGGANAKGAWAALRDEAHAVSTVTIRQNGGAGFTGALTSNVVTNRPNVNFFGLALNNNGTASDFDTDQIAAVWGGCLTSAQSDSVQNDINGGIMTQLGINAY